MNDQPPRDRLSPEMASFRLLVLTFVRDYLSERGASPSYGEISAALDASRSRVKRAVHSLAKDGLLLRSPGPRGLSLPSRRDDAIRQLRELGWTIDDDTGRAVAPDGAGSGTNRSLLPPAELTYPPRGKTGDVDGEQAGNEGSQRAA